MLQCKYNIQRHFSEMQIKFRLADTVNTLIFTFVNHVAAVNFSRNQKILQHIVLISNQTKGTSSMSIPLCYR